MSLLDDAREQRPFRPDPCQDAHSHEHGQQMTGELSRLELRAVGRDFQLKYRRATARAVSFELPTRVMERH